MKSLAIAYAIAASLALPALLWAQDAPPAQEPSPPQDAQPVPGPAATPPPEKPAPAPAATEEPPAAPAQAAAPEVEPKEVEVDASGPVAVAAQSGGVTIQNFAFAPRTITVDVGDTVSWTNRDSAAHTATADDGSFDTGLIEDGQSRSQTFEEPGTIAYHCTPHPNMTATVVVRAAGGGGSTGSTAGGGSGGGDGGGNTTAGGSRGTSAGGSSGSTLPATGFEALAVALAGALLIGAGALLRRRTSRRAT